MAFLTSKQEKQCQALIIELVFDGTEYIDHELTSVRRNELSKNIHEFDDYQIQWALEQLKQRGVVYECRKDEFRTPKAW